MRRLCDLSAGQTSDARRRVPRRSTADRRHIAGRCRVSGWCRRDRAGPHRGCRVRRNLAVAAARRGNMNEPRGPVAGEPAAVIALLRQWLARALTPEAMAWLDAEIDHQRPGVDDRRLGLTLGLVGRKVGRIDLSLTAEDIAAA